MQNCIGDNAREDIARTNPASLSVSKPVQSDAAGGVEGGCPSLGTAA
jgi:hypothetical protein